MKRKVTKLLAAVLAATLLVPAMITNAKPARDYIDVPAYEWYFPYIANVSMKEYMTGLNSYTFGVNENLGRGQFATILYRMAGNPDTTYENKFSDVPNGLFYSIPATWASTAGVIKGYTDGRFGAADSITREQMATMLYRYAMSHSYDTSEKADYSSFSDAGLVSPFASDAISWAVGSGVISGDNGRINPQGHVSRAVCATMIARFTGFEAPKGPGKYSIGRDMPAGEYILVAADDPYISYFNIAHDSSGNIDSLIASDIVDTNLYVTVSNGQYLELYGCLAFHAENALEFNVRYEGMYKVGKDIPAGQYYIRSISQFGGYYAISKDSKHTMFSIVENELFEGYRYITVEDGQYLTLSRAEIAW